MKKRNYLLPYGLILFLALGAIGIPFARVQAMSDVPCDTTALVNAIQNAVNAGGTQSLSLAANCTYTLTAVNNGAGTSDANGLPVIANNVYLTIVGNGATIQRDANAPHFRILSIDNGSTLILSAITLRGGRGADGKKNQLAGSGGAIHNRGTLQISLGNILENRAGDAGKSVERGGDGGGIWSSGTLVITESNIGKNSAGDGGVIKGESVPGGWGGGIYSYEANTTISNSAIYKNVTGKGAPSGGHGGGIAQVTKKLVLANSTLSGNKTGKNGFGGGLFFVKGKSTIINTTIANNSSDMGGGIWNAAAKVKLKNTLIANNDDPNPQFQCRVGEGKLENVANNLDSGTSCGFGSDNGSKSNAKPNLRKLADNGGFTLIHAFKKPSDAFNKGKDSVCNSDPINGQDQRGMTRSQGKHCDIGAFELQVSQPTPTATHTPTQTTTPPPSTATSTPTLTPSPTPTQPAGSDGALDFDGTEDFVEIGTAPSLRLNSDLTLEIWAKPDSFNHESALITRAVESDGDAALNYSYYFYISPTKNLGLYWEWGTGETEIYLTSSVAASINPNEWHHLAVTRDATNSTVRFYVDGVELGVAQSFTTLPTGGSSGRTVIGANPRPNDTTLHFDGQLDEARIWNIVRAPSEIQANLHKQLNAASSGLVAYYKFDEPDGQTINDATSPAENGTLGKTSSVASDDPTRVTLTAGGGDCAGPSNGRVSCWKADNNANDSVGTNNGTAQGGTTYAAGKVGQAFSFDGNDDYVQVADHASLRPTQITVAGWFNAAAFAGTSGGNALIAHGASGSGSLGQYGDTYFLGFYQSKPQFETTTTVTGNHSLYGPNVIPTGQWHHLAATFENGAKKLYLDGALIASDTVSGSLVYETPIPVTIGQDWNVGAPSTNVKFNGLLDEVQIWNRALTAQEILDLYNAQ